MSPKIAHIYGPLYIHSYGLIIAITLIVFIGLLINDHILKKIISFNYLTTLINISIGAAIFSGRLFSFCTESSNNSLIDFIQVWNGGFSVLGSVIGVLLVILLYTWIHAIPLIPFLDRVALYAPFLQGVARLGCFFAGCCYGTSCAVPWAIKYSHYDSLAPLHIYLHPTQLYSFMILVGLFCFFMMYEHHLSQKHGMPISLYLIVVGAERFCVDFFRGNRVFTYLPLISVQQYIALALLFLGLAVFSYFYRQERCYEPL